MNNIETAIVYLSPKKKTVLVEKYRKTINKNLDKRELIRGHSYYLTTE